MSSRITHIRFAENNATSTEGIDQVKLDSGEVESVEDLVRYIDDVSMIFFYTLSREESESFIETVQSNQGKAYIRTRSSRSQDDNLLKLPRF